LWNLISPLKSSNSISQSLTAFEIFTMKLLIEVETVLWNFVVRVDHGRRHALNFSRPRQSSQKHRVYRRLRLV